MVFAQSSNSSGSIYSQSLSSSFFFGNRLGQSTRMMMMMMRKAAVAVAVIRFSDIVESAGKLLLAVVVASEIAIWEENSKKSLNKKANVEGNRGTEKVDRSKRKG